MVDLGPLVMCVQPESSVTACRFDWSGDFFLRVMMVCGGRWVSLLLFFFSAKWFHLLEPHVSSSLPSQVLGFVADIRVMRDSTYVLHTMSSSLATCKDALSTCLFNRQTLKISGCGLGTFSIKPATLRFGEPSLSASLYIYKTW